MVLGMVNSLSKLSNNPIGGSKSNFLNAIWNIDPKM